MHVTTTKKPELCRIKNRHNFQFEIPDVAATLKVGQGCRSLYNNRKLKGDYCHARPKIIFQIVYEKKKEEKRLSQ